MRRALTVFLAAMLLMTLSACQQVIVTSADELRAATWETTTKNGIRSTLTFEDDTATFSVYNAEGEVLSIISGIAAVDSTHLYITDTELCKTYTFSYTVYGDRAEITYGADTLTFTPMEIASSPPAETTFPTAENTG